MLLGATSGAANLSDTIIVLIYLAALVTSFVILVRRIRAKRRLKRQPPPGQDAWDRLLTPLALPAIPAPTRPRRLTPRARLEPASGTHEGPAASAVIDLREPDDDNADEAPAGVLKPLPSEASAISGSSDAPVTAAGRTITPTRPLLAEPYVTVLSQVDVKGWIIEPDRRIVTELAVYLALHRDRPRSAEELLQALWPTRGDDFAKERDIEAVHQAVSRLRRCLGPHAVPDASATGGYLLAGAVSCDWDVFRSLVADARTGVSNEKLAESLSLVSGPPFSGVRKDSYAWVWSELWASRVTAAVVDAAHQLAERALAGSDDAMAESAARRGLDASPAEELLHEDRLRAAASVRDLARFERVWAEVRGALASQAETGPVGDTYRRLRDQLRGVA